ncbi:MAG: hypothetical protein GEV28_10900 [Actinophytocola sp.]|uniref:hypothetical protein n=1 Tax=Actinophytocola sp. TaxID=1872138 RepID=UPI001327BCB7|nr:hypothetical protein [Actinophytocola sp.]MPZ80868.1 hypothetical protein [Actinophytocola sp.]
MSGAWERTHRRYRLVHTVLDEVARTGRPEVSVSLCADLDAEFGDFGGFLREVQRRWYRSFDARLDGVLDEGPADLAAAAREVWQQLADDLAGTRLLLDAHAEHPALLELAEWHRKALVAVVGDDEAELGGVRRGAVRSGMCWWRRAMATA